MIHYHGGELGSHRDQAARFWLGRHAMLSHARPGEVVTVSECCQSFVLDNGAFSAWRGGNSLDLNGLAEWIEQWRCHPGFDWHLAPDVIDGTEADNDALLQEWLSRSSVQKANPVPVWHLHESLERLAKFADEFPRVALGSSGTWSTPGTEAWWERMAEAMNVVCDERGRPRCKLHGLRMLAPDVFTHLPLASADSTNAARNSRRSSRQRFGIYPPLATWQRANIIADRVEMYNSAEAWQPDAWKQHNLFAEAEV